MIKIGSRDFLADQVLEVVRQNTVPVQQVEQGFSVQDHIESLPLQLEIQLILFDDVDDYVYRGDAYEHLKDIYDDKRLVKVDCSEYTDVSESYQAMASVLIYDDMAMTYLGQVVQRGSVYFCTVKFTHITKTEVKSQTLYIQEAKFETDEDGGEVLDENGNPIETYGVRWSKDDFEPTTVATTEAVDGQENPPSCRALSPAGERVTSKNLLEDVWDWASGVKEGLRGSLAFLVNP